MTDLPPSSRPSFQSNDSEGKPAALIAWGLYLLSLPSANALVLVGLLQSDPKEVLSTPMAVAAIAGLSTGLLMGRVSTRKR